MTKNISDINIGDRLAIGELGTTPVIDVAAAAWGFTVRTLAGAAYYFTQSDTVEVLA